VSNLAPDSKKDLDDVDGGANNEGDRAGNRVGQGGIVAGEPSGFNDETEEVN